jgi:quinoprotein relay system zinc metallohydrolase 2
MATFSARAGDDLALEEVAPGIFVYRGPHAEASPANLGAVANASVVVGDAAVAVIDTGGSLAFGRRLRESIRALTPLPVRYVINTHVHPDHIFGNAAFLGDSPDFVGHRKLPRAMAERGPHYQRNFERLVGDRFDGSRLVAPTVTVTDALALDLGGRILRLRAHPSAHTDNDLSVLDVQTGTLFAGDLLFLERTPVVDGDLKGWLTLMNAWRGLAATRVVPGHGPGSAPWPAALADQERYFRVLLTGVREVIRRGGTIGEATRTVGQKEGDKWMLFEDNHPRNVTATFTELEWE